MYIISTCITNNVPMRWFPFFLSDQQLSSSFVENKFYLSVGTSWLVYLLSNVYIEDRINSVYSIVPNPQHASQILLNKLLSLKIIKYAADFSTLFHKNSIHFIKTVKSACVIFLRTYCSNEGSHFLNKPPSQSQNIPILNATIHIEFTSHKPTQKDHALKFLNANHMPQYKSNAPKMSSFVIVNFYGYFIELPYKIFLLMGQNHRKINNIKWTHEC